MRTIAFLRAINVGGHVVKMDHLCELFTSFGLERVKTFIASGNVIFDTPQKSGGRLAERIENGLEADLGYRVATFIRTSGELRAITGYQPFPPAEMEAASAFNIGFLAEEPDEGSKQKLLGLQTDIDRLHVDGREIYWLCQLKQSQSTLSNAAFEKTLGRPCTLRGISTIRKIEKLISS